MLHDNCTPPPEMQVIRNLRELQDGLYVVYVKNTDTLHFGRGYLPPEVLIYSSGKWLTKDDPQIDITNVLCKNIVGVLGPLPNTI